MNRYFKRSLTALCMASVAALIPMSALAQSYGGTPPPYNCLSVDQMVMNPAYSQGIQKTEEFVDNITASGTKLMPGSTAVMRIKVKNTSNQIVPDVKIVSQVPAYFIVFAGSGTVEKDSSGRDIKVHISAGDLQPGEEKIYHVTYKAVGDQMPSSVTCVSTRVTVAGGICGSDDDVTQLCVEKGGSVKGVDYSSQLQAVKVAPKAGPEMGLAILGLNGLLGAAGLIMKRRIA